MPSGVHKTPRLPPLDRMSGLRQLGARIIRETFKGERTVDEGSKLMSMIRVQAELIVGESLEGRLDQVEKYKAGVPLRFAKLKEAA